MMTAKRKTQESCVDRELDRIFHQFGDVVVNIVASNDDSVEKSSTVDYSVGSKTCQVFSVNFTKRCFSEQSFYIDGCNSSVH